MCLEKQLWSCTPLISVATIVFVLLPSLFRAFMSHPCPSPRSTFMRTVVLIDDEFASVPLALFINAPVSHYMRGICRISAYSQWFITFEMGCANHYQNPLVMLLFLITDCKRIYFILFRFEALVGLYFTLNTLSENRSIKTLCICLLRTYSISQE